MNATDFLPPTLILVTVTLLLLWLMWRSWKRRSNRDADFLANVAALSGDTLARFARVFYVSTTPSDAPLERIALPGLAFRGWASVQVRTDGVEITVAGERGVAIPLSAVSGVSTAQLTIDKVVERDGMTALEWVSDRGQISSMLRFDSPRSQQEFAQSVHTMLDARPHTSNPDLTKETP